MTIQVDFPYVITRQEYREYHAMKRAAQRRAYVLASKAARKAYWRNLYWSQLISFETFKVGGLRFIKLGSLSISICVTRPVHHLQDTWKHPL